MIIIRTLPVILATLLFAAHVMRYGGLYPALLVVALLITLLVPRYWVLHLWRVLIGLAIIEWLRTAIILVRMRLMLELPYIRLMLIMALVVLFNGFVLYWLNRRQLRYFYKRPSQQEIEGPPG